MNTWIILGITFSVFTNIIFVMALFVEPYKSIAKRWYAMMTHHKGKRLNCLFLTKSGSAVQKYLKITKDKTVMYQEEPYVINRKLLYNLGGLPTQIYEEGNPRPVDPQNADNDISTSELNRIMMTAGIADFKEWIKQMFLIGAIGIGLNIILISVTGYFGFEVYNVIVEGASTTVTGAEIQGLN